MASIWGSGESTSASVPGRAVSTSPCRAQRRSREHGFGGGRRRAAREAGEHRRVGAAQLPSAPITERPVA
jgi:hypothetical protein